MSSARTKVAGWAAAALAAGGFAAAVATAEARAADGARAQASDDATARHAFDDVDRWVERFEDPEREAWQKPSELLLFLSVFEGQTVVDLGAGTGYMVPGLSAAVGETGSVYAVDVEPKMVEHLRNREDYPFDNVRPVLAAPDDPRLPEGEADLIFVLNTWHHIDDRLDYVKKLERALADGGRIAIVDWHEGELPQGPPPGHKLSREAVIAEMGRAGWALTAESVLLPYQYALIFMPKEDATAQPLD